MSGLGPVGPAPDGEVEDFQVQIAARVDLSVTTLLNPPVASIGETVEVTVDVSNAGPAFAGSVNVVVTSDAGLQLQSWVCNDAGSRGCGATAGSGAIDETITLASGETTTFVVQALVLPGSGSSATVDASVSSESASEVDLFPENDTATATVVLPIFSDGFESGDTTAWN